MQNILSSTIAIQQQQQQQNQQQQLQQKQQQKINNSKDTSPLNQTGSFRNGQQKKSFIFQNNYANKNLINNKVKNIYKYDNQKTLLNRIFYKYNQEKKKY
ncbi:hypothetical protein PPERSA_00003 [Pseudocohnilembus persalinus]|uniref:Uncharacterized protein n=1 Tax=Pseudocohnilembus persalinus TaxID=266149 RepID=A0A0V0QV54_PSEPJ|nr:hypothetical protein PPERSA_00003 [Pseudocohnilembus persalinus]|eukprot:KRX06123.1 hypothetical protein PPERSA_00003 [Pseudocohnilembus persalinus]